MVLARWRGGEAVVVRVDGVVVLWCGSVVVWRCGGGDVGGGGSVVVTRKRPLRCLYLEVLFVL